MTSLHSIFAFFAQAFASLEWEMGSTDEQMAHFVSQLGWTLPQVPPCLRDLQTASASVRTALDTLDEASWSVSQGLTPDSEVTTAALAVVQEIALLLEELRALPDELRSQLSTTFIDESAIDNAFNARLLNWLTASLLSTQQPVLYRLGILLGVIEEVEEAADPATHQPAFTRYAIRWERIPQLFHDPSGLLGELYGWGTPDLDVERLFHALLKLSIALGVAAVRNYPTEDFIQAVAPGAVVPADTGPEPQLWFPLFETDTASVHLVIYPLAKVTPQEPQGLSLTLVLSSGLDASIELGANVMLNLAGSAGIGSGAALVLRPGRAPSATLDAFEAGAALTSGRIALEIVAEWDDHQSLLTVLGNSSLAVKKLYLGGGIEVGGDGHLDAYLEAGLSGGSFTIQAPEGDGFLNAVLPEDGLQVDVDLGLVWSHGQGLHVRGNAGLEAVLAANKTLGPLTIQTVHAGIQTAGDYLRSAMTISASLRLGPVTAVVERIGIAAAYSLPADGNGNLGPVQLDLDFKLPDGVGLSIGTHLITGGGFLLYDPDKQRYAGVLILEMGQVTMNAVGLLTTRLPDGRKGYSLLISIAASGFTPIQLGLGFTLDGVGGVLGVNRSVQVEVLRAGLKNQTLDTVLFPTNPQAQLPHLVHAFERVFPVTVGRYLLGPVVQIGWGTPTRLTLELAVLLELPAPVRLILLGQLRAVLPTVDAPIVQLKMDALGGIDFEEGTASLDAILYDSRIMSFGLSGDMAMRARWKSDPGFLLAVGGVHPRFTAPAALALPRLKRLTIDFTRSDNPRLRLAAYLALTSNTLQFGARAELYVAVSELNLRGSLGFDVLISLAPFGFIADLSGDVEVRWGSHTLFGVYLDATLEGPDPLFVRGKAKIKVWIFSKTVSFEHLFGDADVPPSLPTVDPLPALVAALRDTRNWSAQLPTAGSTLVTLRHIPAASGVVLAHPLGTLTVTQSVVPLNLTIERYGRGVPAGERRFTLDAVALGDDPTPPQHPIQEWFAPGQFFHLTDTQRLSRPSFERLDAGLRLGSDHVAYGDDKVIPMAHETTIIDPDGHMVSPGGSTPFEAVPLSVAVPLGAVARQSPVHAGRARYAGPPGGVEIVEPGYAIVQTDALQPMGTLVRSVSMALQALAALPPSDGGDVAPLQVIGAHVLEEVTA